MPGESLSFSITADDRASSKFRDVGRAAADAGAKIDFAAGSLKLWDDTAIKQGKAATTSQNAMKAHAQAAKLLADAENVLAGKATTTTKLMADQGREIDKTAESAAKAAGSSGLGALIGNGGVGGGGLVGVAIAAGVLAAPAVVTLGFGLSGLAGAAYGIYKPISNAAQATGGLAANLHKLNPEQQQVARGILTLGKNFAGFQNALQPTVLGDFDKALRLAGTLLHNIEPVTAATGKGLGAVLDQLTATFRDGTWQQFFSFMGRTAAPDIQLLGKNFTDLLNALPPLLEQLQPVSQDFLHITDDTARLIGYLAKTNQSLDGTGQHMNTLQHITASLRTLLFDPGVGLAAALNLVSKATGSLSSSSDSTGEHLVKVNQALAALSITWSSAPAKAAPATDAITRMAQAAQATFVHAGPATDAITRLGTDSGAAAGHVKPLTDEITMMATANEKAFRSAGPLGDEISRLAIPAAAAAVHFEDIAKAVTAINTAEAKSLSTANAYAGDLVTQANDAKSLEAALDKSRDSIGLQTAAQRNSFAAANTYITDLSNTAQQAYTSGHGVDASIAAIKRGLPILDQAKTKNQAYWQEVKTLVGWLNQLRLEKAIHENVYVSGTGTFTVRPGSIGLPGGTAGGPFAAGGRVPGGYPNDTYPARLTSGEAVVPAHLTPAVAPFLSAHGVPGFAAGGLIGGYSGTVAGIVPWSRHDLNATVGIFEQSIARATLAGIKAAAQASSAGGVPGPGGGSPAANAALARRMMPSWGVGAQWNAWNYVAMRESGWSQFARNPSSGAYGIPQALPPSKMGPAANPPQSNPHAQISWMIGYISGRYGSPIGAAAHEQAYNWYDRGGWLKPGLTLAYNGTGRPEMVLPNSGSTAIAVQVEWVGGAAGDGLLQWIQKNVRIRGGGDVQKAFGRA